MDSFCSRNPSPGMRQAGFTMPEMFLVLLIIGFFAINFGNKMVGKADDSKYSITKSVLLTSLPGTLSAMYQSQSQLQTGADITQQLIDRGVPSETPWGSTWRAVVRESYVSVDYPLPRSEDAARLANAFKQQDLATEGGLLMSVHATSGSEDIEARYLRPRLPSGV